MSCLRATLDRLKLLWQEKRILIILLTVQITLNSIGQFLPDGFQVAIMALSGAVLLVFSVYAVYEMRGNILVMLLNIMLLYFNYSLVVAVYWKANALNPIFTGYTREEFLKCINIELLFYGAYVLFLDGKIVVDKFVYVRKATPKYFVVAMCSLYIALAPFLFYHTESFGVRGIITAPYEYSLIVMIVGLCFSKRKVTAILPLAVASLWIIAHGLMHGERILALQMIIIWGVYLLLHKLTIKLIVPACIVGVFSFTVFGIFRGATSLDGDFVKSTVNHLLNERMANDTSYYAYWASMSIERFAEATPFFERLLYFIKYVGYVFLGSIIPNFNLSTLSVQLNVHVGGGWLPFYTYFWGGYIGSLLTGVGLAALLNKATNLHKKRNFLNYLAIYLVATAPRWYLYAPATLTRGVLFFALFYGGCCLVGKLLPFLIDRVKIMAQKRRKGIEYEGDSSD